MKKNNFFFLILFFLIFIFEQKSFGSEEQFFLSLKNNEVNLRQGPSFEYPIKLTYKKKYLPVLIIDKLENWRQIKDITNNSGWIHTSQLSGKKSAINTINHSIIYKKNTIYSKPIAKLEKGRLVLIKKCDLEWCKITSGGYNGWTLKKNLWGKIN